MNELEKVLDEELKNFEEFTDNSFNEWEEISTEDETTESFLFTKSKYWKVEPFDENYGLQDLEVFQDNTSFKDHFYNQGCYHLAVQHSENGSFVFSVISSPTKEDRLLVLCDSQEESQMKEISSSSLEVPFINKLFCKGPPVSSVVKAFDENLEGSKVVSCLNQKEEQEILTMENTSNIKQFKFGVIYVSDGQTQETDFLSNQKGSSEWDEFLDLLGDHINLLGWKEYSGGLNTKRDRSGKQSVFTKWNDFDIMWHVSTLLPYSEKDPQQLIKKKHIGNDVVVIIFIDGKGKYNPESLKSRQNHILIAVQPLTNKNETKYRVEVVSKKSVPLYQPQLPVPPIFGKEELRDFLLTKGHCKRLAKPYGEAADAFVNEQNVVLAEVECDSDGKDLCEKYAIRGYPTLYFFGRNKKDDKEDYAGGRELEDIVKYMNEKAGTFRLPDGSLDPAAGRNDELDKLAQRFMEETEERDNILEETEKKNEELENEFVWYAKVMRMIIKKGDDYIETEPKRLEKMINSGNLSKKKIGDFSKKLLVLEAFNLEE
ncbi:endoplasmic reticulum resident protein [Anaeramoeba flamelloides]|uniref:Endoplasmic reticulum resident protein n=1 Tax=Anaeramoeba flamelloides TaxID=1746091 RepID=A0ABQ8XI05_9EUKA|nr:endoplasmic reticulum resident protein [Anaeramoeba flamelloides]